MEIHIYFLQELSFLFSQKIKRVFVRHETLDFNYVSVLSSQPCVFVAVDVDISTNSTLFFVSLLDDILMLTPCILVQYTQL